ncbi:MAG TPA: cupin domain-containing protein, partial [Methanomicrobiales archaeon]|nr:cupin domain-containing protein [Methanomicrobiales archaeon]
MHRIALLLFTCMLLTAGCLSSTSTQAQTEGIQLISPAAEKPIFDGQAAYFGLIGDETPQINANYSTGEVVIHPGNGTTPHHLVGTTELVYILSGEAEISLENESILAGEGETILLPQNVKQSITAAGDADLHYITVIEPPFTSTIEIHENESAPSSKATNRTPIVVPNPQAGIEWNSETGVTVYTLINPELMPEREIPINYSIAYAEYIPGGHLGF